MIARFRRPSRGFLGSSVLKESIKDFYLQKKQWLIRKKHTPKGGVGQEERDKMENHSAIRTWALLSHSHPSSLILMGPWVQLGSLHLLASTWPTEPFPQLCVVFSIPPQAAIDKREVSRFLALNLGQTMKILFPFPVCVSVCVRGQEWTCLTSHLQ